MKVCDRHMDRRAIDTLIIVRDDTHIDVCSECRTDILAILTAPPVNKGIANRIKDALKNSAQAG